MRLVIFCFLISSSIISAQNLVFNSGFERQSPREAGVWRATPKPCEISGGSLILNTSAQGWRTFELQTPDLIVWDSAAGCPIFPKPHKGKRMLGLIMYHPFQDGRFAFDYHELVQGTLAKPLEKGKTYRVSFWVYTNDSLGAQILTAAYGRTTDIRPTYCGNFGFYFSDRKIQIEEDFMESQLDFAVRPQLNLEEIIEPTGEWRKITLSYKADQAYKYFLFGNFFSDAVTKINMGEEERMRLDERNQALEFWQKTKRVSYYLFDDFVIAEDDGGAAMEQSLLKEKKYTFQSALLFDTGKADLKAESQVGIQQLAEVLQKNTALKVEIGGHTDDVGDDTSNQTLSEQRAQSVYNALIAKKVMAGQLSWKGYGESKPVTANDTETGRQKNRRVECSVIK